MSRAPISGRRGTTNRRIRSAPAFLPPVDYSRLILQCKRFHSWGAESAAIGLDGLDPEFGIRTPTRTSGRSSAGVPASVSLMGRILAHPRKRLSRCDSGGGNDKAQPRGHRVGCSERLGYFPRIGCFKKSGSIPVHDSFTQLCLLPQ